MEVSDRIIVFSKGRLEQVGTPADIYEEPATEFVARFIGAMNILEAQVRAGTARAGPFEFPAPGYRDGQTVRVGFRPYSVKVSEEPEHFRLQARLRHIYFLGVAYRLEIETEDGFVLRSRMNKEEFRRHRFELGWPVSFAITEYRILPEAAESDRPPSTPRPPGSSLTP